MQFQRLFYTYTCALIIVSLYIAQLLEPRVSIYFSKIEYTNGFSSNIETNHAISHALMFDYPRAWDEYEKAAALLASYKKVLRSSSLRKEAASLSLREKIKIEQLFYKAHITPYWKGIYSYSFDNNFLSLLQHDVILMCEKIRAGEYWRCLTPIFLHGSFFHLGCNLLWIFLLFPTLELFFHKKKYLLLCFICITSLTSNMAQYIMSGANFLGFSGVLAATGGFLFQKIILQKAGNVSLSQKKKNELVFLRKCIFIPAYIAAILYFVDRYLPAYSLSLGLANTAHISGWYCGSFLGKIKKIC